MLARQVRGGVADWIAARRDEGWLLAYERIGLSGFPGNVTLTFDRPSLLRSTAAGTVSWHGSTLSLTAPVWNLGRVAFSLPGRQEVEAVELNNANGLRLSAADVAGTFVTGSDGVTWSSMAEAKELAVARAADGAPLLYAPAARASINGATTPGPLRFDGSLHRVDLAQPGPFGPTLEQARLAFILSIVPPGAELAALEAWRAANGRLEVEQLAFRWGPVGLEARGTLGLDGQLRPAGELRARVSGFEPAIDVLVRQGRIPAENGPALKLLGRLLALGTAGGPIEIPVRIEGGWVHAGPSKLLPVPPLPVLLFGTPR